MQPEHNHTHEQPLPLKSEFLSFFEQEIATGCVFRTKPATDSDRKRPLIPIDSGHRFRRKAATPS